jgi:uncharacterized membrane protein (UPF0127 family)
MTVGRLRTVKVVAGLLVAACLGPGGLARGQEVSKYGNPWVWVSLGRVTVQAEAVRTPARLYLGLSNRRSLPEGHGMLFLMPEKEEQTFCMRGMRFPLDFIWINQRRVAGITRNVPPTFAGDLKSPGPVDEVLEVPGGFAQKYGVRVGDRVTWRRGTR